VNHTTLPYTLFNGEALYFLAVTLSCIIASHLLFGELHVIPSTPGVDFPGLEVTFFTASALAEKSCIRGGVPPPRSIYFGRFVQPSNHSPYAPLLSDPAIYQPVLRILFSLLSDIPILLLTFRVFNRNQGICTGGFQDLLGCVTVYVSQRPFSLSIALSKPLQIGIRFLQPLLPSKA